MAKKKGSLKEQVRQMRFERDVALSRAAGLATDLTFERKKRERVLEVLLYDVGLRDEIVRIVNDRLDEEKGREPI